MKELLADCVRRLIAIEQLVPDPHQPRQCMDQLAIVELAKNLAQHNQLTDLIVYEETSMNAAIENVPKPTGRYIVVDGHRRRMAAESLGLKELRCLVLPRRPSPRELLTIQFSVNEQREPLKPLERLEVFKRFMHEFGMKQSELPDWFGISKSTVSNILKLQESTDEERALLTSGRLGVSAAAALCRMDAATRRDALAEVKSGNITRDELQTRSKRRTPDASPLEESKAKRFTFELPIAKATIAAAQGFSIEQLLKLLDELMRICKKARSEGLDITTVERVLRDRMNASRTESEASHVS